MAEFIRRVYRASVWHPDGVRQEDERVRGLFRVVLPLMDVMLIVFGLVSWQLGLRSLQESTGHDLQSWWSLGIAVSAAVAFVGVAFPRLSKVELAGKIPLIMLLTFYIATLFLRGLDDGLVAAATAILSIPIIIAIWRVGDLGFVRWARKRGRL